MYDGAFVNPWAAGQQAHVEPDSIKVCNVRIREISRQHGQRQHER